MLEENLHSLIDKRIESIGYQVVTIKYITYTKTLQITIDFPNTQNFIGIEDCLKVSKEISSMLRIENLISPDCSIEVSSPGLDRPLVKLEDFIKYKGRKIKLTLKNIVNGVKKCKAIVADVIDSFVVLELYNEQKMTVNCQDIESARLLIDDVNLFKTIKNHDKHHANQH